ncbi:DNA/RNA helicase domain-containing protein [Streptomyces californicus]|uniref:DNA/RNA helicase domain-containing protein n=1 Tax=Streptomyces californicus TaxID=67351 RepID=UPI00296F2F54|nr:DNA/RNA helicase domain-containing protein [Streptomyces californicus]MDW4903388.1 DNA/RNA helicase domain-containing protein [Streptomyces californicus]
MFEGSSTTARALGAAPRDNGAAGEEPAVGVRCAAAGRVHEIASSAGDPAFIDRCVKRYTTAGFGVPDEAEVRSWRKSWPPLLEALVRAGLSDLQIYLEYGTPGGGQRLDAVLVGRSAQGALGLVVVELKQWQRARVLDGMRVRRSDGLVTTHPVQQVLAYGKFFEFWRPERAPVLDIRAAVVLHNADREQGETLRIRDGAGADVPVVSGQDLAGQGAGLAARLGCAGLASPTVDEVGAFERIVWAPSARLLAQVGNALMGQRTFALVGDQQHAYVQIRALVAALLEGDPRGAVVTVSGGPGSGKTALAVRLLGYLMRHREKSRPRFVTPSGTLRAHLLEAAGGQAHARDLFPPVSSLYSTAQHAGSVIIDEAQRMARSNDRHAPALAEVLRKVPLAVVFLDERQIIRPGEGTTVEELRDAARAMGRAHHHFELTGSFRCNGSAAYTTWVDNLLYSTPTPWTGHDSYDLDLSDDPFQLQHWIEQATADGHTARTTAGFCWPWTRTRPRGATTLPLDLTITVPATPAGPARTWKAAWNAADTLTGTDGQPLAPHNQLWATHTGGHQQIGCIYSAQGLEYHHAGVIIGPDLTWTDGRWTAHPGQSHDPKLRRLAPDQYLPYALNTYRVLLTRGTHTTRIHTPDPATRQHLATLLRPGGTR